MKIEKGSYIGTKAYPRDNSYNYNILTKKEGLLAGTYFTPSVEVTIISEPYKLQVKGISGNELFHEFVTVMYEGEAWVYLNSFSSESNAIEKRYFLDPNPFGLGYDYFDLL